MKKLLLLALVLIECEKTRAQSLDDESDNHRGELYMPFRAQALDDVWIDNNSLKGKVVFLNFWFTNCPGCVKEMPQLNYIYDQLKTDTSFRMYGITFDSRKQVGDFVRKKSISYPIALVKSQTEAYRMNFNQGFPTTIILNRDGRVAYWGMAIITDDKDGVFFHSKHTMLSLVQKLLNKTK